VDNLGTDILINGASTGIANAAGFVSLTPFTITSGLVAGPNTLDFIVNNLPATPNPTGLRVDLRGYLRIEGPARPKLSISRNGGVVTISWSPTGAGMKLQSAATVIGPWKDVDTTGNSYTTDATGAAQFFRVVGP
jgi:hypothetical protein